MKRMNFGIKDECTGCGACAAICPKHCIEMSHDELGFLNARLSDSNSCIDCGMCHKVCPQKNIRQNVLETRAVVFGQSKQEKDLLNSTSGGFFSLIAKAIIERGGIVYGVTMDKNGDTRFEGICDIEGLKKIRGSKYVEVTNPLPFREIRDKVKSGKLVMVSGVPCQLLGLYKYLGERTYPNLYLVDLFCYGVQSPHIWHKYLSEVNPLRKEISFLSMRYKKPSWKDYSIRIDYEDGTSYLKSRWEDPYLLSYAKGLYNRESCTKCESKKFPKVTDFTLGDFWGVEWMNGNIGAVDKKKGVSIVFMHTEKARALFSLVKESFQYRTLSISEVSKLYGKLGKSNPLSPLRNDFLKRIENDTFESAVYSTGEHGMKAHLKDIIKSRKLKVRLAIKRLLKPIISAAK